MRDSANTTNELYLIGVNTEDGLYILALLHIPSNGFKVLSISLEVPIDSITVEERHAFMNRERMRQSALEGPSGPRAFSAYQNLKEERNRGVSTEVFPYRKKAGHRDAKGFKDERMRNLNRFAEEPNLTNSISAKRNAFSSEWYMGSASSYHICDNIRIFSSRPRFIDPLQVTIRHGSKITAKYRGDLQVRLRTEFGLSNVTLKDVLDIPQSNVNLPSVAQIRQSGYTVTFGNNECCIFNSQSKMVVLH